MEAFVAAVVRAPVKATAVIVKRSFMG